MNDFSEAPHPLLTSSTLYVADVTKRIKWSHLVEAFQPCGMIRSGGKSNVACLPGRKKWAVLFSDVHHAEMALATLQGAALPGVHPPFILNLSHSPLLQSATPTHRLLPQFVHTDMGNHPVLDFTAQQAFQYFRQAGPLVSVHVDVDVGRGRRTCVVEYWHEEHANHARLNARMLQADTEEPPKVLPFFCLRTYDPCNLWFHSNWVQISLWRISIRTSACSRA